MVSFHIKIKQTLDDTLEKLPDEFNMTELTAKVEERTPYTVVALQECERINILVREMKRSLQELDLGLKVIIRRSSRKEFNLASLKFSLCKMLSFD